MNAYEKLQNRHQREFNDFPMYFAFGEEQFVRSMAKLGLTQDDTDKVYKFGDTGGLYRRADAPRLREMLDRHAKERKEAIDSDTTGKGYIFDMFLYELANHEYCYTRDITDTLEACRLSYNEVEKNPKLSLGLRLAIRHYNNTVEP